MPPMTVTTNPRMLAIRCRKADACSLRHSQSEIAPSVRASAVLTRMSRRYGDAASPVSHASKLLPAMSSTVPSRSAPSLRQARYKRGAINNPSCGGVVGERAPVDSIRTPQPVRDRIANPSCYGVMPLASTIYGLRYWPGSRPTSTSRDTRRDTRVPARIERSDRRPFRDTRKSRLRSSGSRSSRCRDTERNPD